jgi:hypothetical protein
MAAQSTGEPVMLSQTIVIAGIIAVFAAFAVVLAWTDYRTHH